MVTTTPPVISIPDWKLRMARHARRILFLLFCWGICFELLLMVSVTTDPGTDTNGRAIFLMGLVGLWGGWITVCGSLMFAVRNWVRARFPSVTGRWGLAFVLVAITLLLIEEGLTVSMTNFYAIFGGEYGKAFITASDNYWEVVGLHSAIVIWPGFLFWAWWLRRYDFHPNMVMLLYGLTGCFGEMIYGGLSQLFGIGMWVFVYGLMIYLPAYAIPTGRAAQRPKIRHYVLALLLPIAFQLPMITAVLAVRAAIGHSFPFIPN